MLNAKTGLGQMFLPWITQVGSLDRQHIMTYQRWFDDRGFNISDFIEEIDVRCLSVAELLADARVAPGQVRVLVVDTEGFDGKIIRGIDFTAKGCGRAHHVRARQHAPRRAAPHAHPPLGARPLLLALGRREYVVPAADGGPLTRPA